MARLLAVFLFAASVRSENVTVQLLVTTDMHGNLRAWDYYTAKPVPRGLTRLATLIKTAKQSNPNTLLLDVGDTIQGTPMEAVHQGEVRDGKAQRPDPMMAAMNILGYSAMAVGNHEYNFGLKNLGKARDEAKFPWLSANTAAKGGARPFDPVTVKTVGGVKVGVFGITTPNIPNWEKPENYAGYSFLPGVEGARKAVEKLRAEGVDLVVGLVHAGLTPKTGAVSENMADTIAREVPGIDAIYFGHTHQVVELMDVHGVMLVQPKNWAGSLAQSEFSFEKTNGRWKLQSKKNKLLAATMETAEDAELTALAAPYHQAAEQWLSTPIATADTTLDGARGRVQDSALVDAIHEVQLFYTKADVSFTSLFNPRVHVKAGPVTIREIAALYLYENELYAVEGTGATVKAALENSARFFLPCKTSACDAGPLIDRSRPGYNFDMAQGVSYEIDLSRPDGDRIRNLSYKGRPLDPGQKLKIAVNNYRAGGSNGYTMFKTTPIVYRSNREIRDMIIEYYSEHKHLPSKPDNNWRIVPDSARKVLEAEAASP